MIGKGLDEKYVLFPSTEATEQHRDDSTAFSNFKQDVEKYFPNFNGVIGKAFYAGGHLQDLSIDIPIQFYGKTEGHWLYAICNWKGDGAFSRLYLS